VLLAAVYLALCWLFGGIAGLVVGAIVVVARGAFALPATYFWIGSLAAMAAAPAATIAQGLPGRSVVGPEFGEHHLAAHVLVGVSLALAGFAGLLELDRTHWRRPRGRAAAAVPARRRVGREAGPASVAPTPVGDGAPPPVPVPAEPEPEEAPAGIGTAQQELLPPEFPPAPVPPGPRPVRRPTRRRSPAPRKRPSPPPAGGAEPPPAP
jgi:hypothetical protein